MYKRNDSLWVEIEQFLWHDTIFSVDPLHVPATQGCHYPLVPC
jgi:hypothetical protein